MKALIALTLLLAGTAFADTVYNLPDPAVAVDLRSGNTAVTIDGVRYQAASQFVYFAPCVKPNGPHYHCSIQAENDVTLTSATGGTVVASITAQFASTLITSGHNYWRSTQTVLSGQVTTP